MLGPTVAMIFVRLKLSRDNFEPEPSDFCVMPSPVCTSIDILAYLLVFIKGNVDDVNILKDIN